ncbi:MAG: hypothetical protein EYC70_05790 [Planctomycetota bacterium]|nr:MAG: hypothetical protein EYC70_05790 [Planctomycetota bacterium]
MGRLFHTILGRPQNILSMPVVGEALPTQRPGFTAGDPRPWIPGTLALLQQGGAAALPWTRDRDLLLAPYPAPGDENGLLQELLRSLPDRYPVALYERDTPLVPNLLLPGPAPDGLDFRDPAAGLRAYRSGFRHQGRGGAEACVLLPARRLSLLLRGSSFAAMRPGGGDSLQNRRFLLAALDHQRTLDALSPYLDGGALAPAQRVLVLMPHFDDEVIQCGGAILQALQDGAELAVAWLTDGRKGVSTLSEAQSARVRHEEAEAVMSALGVKLWHFLDAPETRLRRRGPWTGRLAALLREFQPERVHTVWWDDNNADHYEASRVLRKAWPGGMQDVAIAASGLWTPLPGGALLPLAAEQRRRKDEALRAYASQLAEVDYLRVERGLSCYYGRRLPEPGYAEAFLTLPAAEYWRAFRRSGADRRWFIGA